MSALENYQLFYEQVPVRRRSYKIPRAKLVRKRQKQLKAKNVLENS